LTEERGGTTTRGLAHRSRRKIGIFLLGPLSASRHWRKAVALENKGQGTPSSFTGVLFPQQRQGVEGCSDIFFGCRHLDPTVIITIDPSPTVLSRSSRFLAR
jgi:hypothetical protein